MFQYRTLPHDSGAGGKAGDIDKRVVRYVRQKFTDDDAEREEGRVECDGPADKYCTQRVCHAREDIGLYIALQDSDFDALARLPFRLCSRITGDRDAHHTTFEDIRGVKLRILADRLLSRLADDFFRDEHLLSEALDNACRFRADPRRMHDGDDLTRGSP